jgi:NAD(P)-dependent dehydrogenase (short-subunit alcohol dehydrogenase family)
VDVLVISDAVDAGELRSRIDDWAGDGPITGVYWLAALDPESPIEEMGLDEWREALRARVKLLYAAVRHVYGRIGDAGTFLVSATRLGGRHGYDETVPPAPMGGAVSGFTKTFKREKPGALVKVVDFPLSRKTAAIADALIDETLADPGAVEIGRSGDGRRWSVTLTELPLPVPQAGLDLGPDSVFVVTGAAGSIVSAIITDLAAAWGGTYHLLDLVAEPDRDNPLIALFRNDREALKRQVFESLKETGERATPALVEKEIARVERASAALAAIEAIESAGGTAHYHSVDLRDGAAMAAVTASISRLHDRVDVLLHAAGLEISRLLPDKNPEEFDLVFDVKADGWFNLLHGLRDTPIGATVAFSSIAGRFGNAGQTDYSAANDLLCKSTFALRGPRPDISGIAIDWTAWADIGMASRGSIPTVMRAAGIDMLPATAGVPIVRRELAGAAGTREVVIARQLGMLQDELHPTGGFDPAKVNTRARASVMVGTVRSFGVHEGLRVETTLDPTEQGFLRDHQIDGTPVLPGVMGLEAFAEAALLPFDDLLVSAIEDVDFLAPFKFYRNEPRALIIEVRYRADGDDVLADCALYGARDLVTSPDPQVTKHFTGRVRLTTARPALPDMPAPAESGDGVEAEDVYRIYFHGPAYQVVDHAWRVEEGTLAGELAKDLPPNHHPTELATAISPRLLELCFQTAGIWELGTAGTLGLPRHIDRVVLGAAEDAGGDHLRAIVRTGNGSFDAVVVDASGRSRLEMDGYRTIQLPGSLTEAQLRPLRIALSRDG